MVLGVGLEEIGHESYGECTYMKSTSPPPSSRLRNEHASVAPGRQLLLSEMGWRRLGTKLTFVAQFRNALSYLPPLR